MSTTLLFSLLTFLNFGPAPLSLAVPPDAVILREELTFTLNGDGSITRREHKKVRINNPRAISAFADPRIPYREGMDTLTIRKAVTHLADGTVLPVPAYSLNTATPGDIAGWPRYARWRERIISFSGIEPGVVLELDFELRGPASEHPRLSRDLRITANYPITEKVVSVALPDRIDLKARLDVPGGGLGEPVVTRSSGRRTIRWRFRGLPAMKAEPGSVPWQLREPRLRFSTFASADEWASGYLDLILAAAEPDAAIQAFARAAVGKEEDARKRCKLLCSALAGVFHLVKSGKAMQPPRCEPAATIFASNYGNRLELAALLTACLRSLDMDAMPAIVVEERFRNEAVPTDSSLRDVQVICLGVARLDPLRGVLDPPRTRELLFHRQGPRDGVQRSPVGGHEKSSPNEVAITGRLDLDREGRLSGDLTVLCINLGLCRSLMGNVEKQKQLANDMLGRLIPGLTAEAVAVEQLSEYMDTVSLRIKARTKEPLAKLAGTRVLRLGAEPLFRRFHAVHLDAAARETAVAKIPGGVTERVALEIRFPDKFKLLALPPAVELGRSDDIRLEQKLSIQPGRVSLARTIHLAAQTVAPDVFEPFRRAVNRIRSEAGRTFIFEEK